MGVSNSIQHNTTRRNQRMNLPGFERIEIQATTGGKSYLTTRPYVTVSSTTVGFSRRLVNDLHSPRQVAFYKGQKGSGNEDKIAIVPVEEGGSPFLNHAKAHQECKKRVDLKNKQILQLFQKNLLMGFGTYYVCRDRCRVLYPGRR